VTGNPEAVEFSLNVLLLTDEDGFESSLPTLSLFTRSVRCAPLATTVVTTYHGADVAVVDARTDLPAARHACRRLAASAPLVAVVAVVAAEDFVAVDVDWNVDEVLLTNASAAELHARFRLAIARRRQAVEGTLQFGDLILHPASYTASLANRSLDLTLTEFKLLNYLVQHAGRAFTRTRLMHEVWGRECSRRTVDVHVQRLRAKLGKLGAEYESIVDTVRGVGYMAPSPPQPRRTVADSLESGDGEVPIAVAQ
jgi:DNA-binding response OmpR family regulator